MKITFEVVKYKHKAKDANGKVKQCTFEQTINPWNNNADGSIKTREDILIELKVQAHKWELDIKTL